MSVYDLKSPPPPLKTSINEKVGLFNPIWSRWLSDFYAIVEAKLSLSLVKNGLISSLTSPVVISNSSAETVLLSGIIDRNTVAAGTTFIIKCFGLISTHSISPILTFRVRIGTTTLAGTIANAFYVSCTSGIVSQFYSIDICNTIITIGSTGTLLSNGTIQNSFSPNVLIGSANTANIVFDSTATNLIEITAQFNNAHASNIISSRNGSIEVKNSIIA